MKVPAAHTSIQQEAQLLPRDWASECLYTGELIPLHYTHPHKWHHDNFRLNTSSLEFCSTCGSSGRISRHSITELICRSSSVCSNSGGVRNSSIQLSCTFNTQQLAGLKYYYTVHQYQSNASNC